MRGRVLAGLFIIFEAKERRVRPTLPCFIGAGSGTSKPDEILLEEFTVYIEQPRVKGRGEPPFSTCHWTPTEVRDFELGEGEEEISSTTKVKVGGRAEATFRRCDFRAGRPTKGVEYWVSS